jgi:acetylornithine deacetylase/succinyl-diaminopimelate desuccinylase-like protein
VAVAAIAVDAVAAADAAVIAATVVTAATAGKTPHLSSIRSLTSGALFLRPKSFAFGPASTRKIHSPPEFVLANPWASV